jgi:hypothetical protein
MKNLDKEHAIVALISSMCVFVFIFIFLPLLALWWTDGVLSYACADRPHSASSSADFCFSFYVDLSIAAICGSPESLARHRKPFVAIEIVISFSQQLKRIIRITYG